MNKKNIIFICLLLFIAFTACEPYEEYLNDYKYSAVYFATQKPLRTIVSYDEMEFKVGVALAGKRENNAEEYANFQIDPSLLDDQVLTEGNNFELLPPDYYTLSNDTKMIVPPGEFIGDITVSLNKDAFTSDEKATNNHYAIPFRITGASTDTILQDKNYTILVVKYISEYDGTYYHKGMQSELDSTGTAVNDTIYSYDDLIDNETWNVSTINANTIKTPAAGTFGNGSILIEVNGDNTVDISTGRPTIEVTSESGTYDPENRRFYLDYSFIRGQTEYAVQDTLILRQAPEKDLFFEEW